MSSTYKYIPKDKVDQYIYEYDDPSYDETVYIKFIGDEISFICYKFYK